LSGLAHSWKTWTARKINAHLERTGSVWQREYHDRYIRDEVHLSNAIRYMEQDPVKAGLCQNAADWLFGSAHPLWKRRDSAATSARPNGGRKSSHT
jgi:putative DNA methylase